MKSEERKHAEEKIARRKESEGRSDSRGIPARLILSGGLRREEHTLEKALADLDAAYARLSQRESYDDQERERRRIQPKGARRHCCSEEHGDSADAGIPLY
jgi:hypothetical protein